jgi:hypothetical protein
MRRLSDLQERAETKLNWPEAKKQGKQFHLHAEMTKSSAGDEDRVRALAGLALSLGDASDIARALGATTAADRLGSAIDGLERDMAGADGLVDYPEQAERTDSPIRGKSPRRAPDGLDALAKITGHWDAGISMMSFSKPELEILFHRAEDAPAFITALKGVGVDAKIGRKPEEVLVPRDQADKAAKEILALRPSSSEGREHSRRLSGLLERDSASGDAEYEKGAEESAKRLDASLKGVEERLQEDVKWLKELAPEVSFDDVLDDIWSRADVRYRGIIAEPGGDPHGKHHAHLVVTPGKKAGR